MITLKQGILAIAAVLFASVGTANAGVIVNLDAKVHGAFNTHGVHLDSGTWYITPIGVGQGGDFNAFSFSPENYGDCLTNPTCASGTGDGYRHFYSVSVGMEVLVGGIDTWDGLIYADPLDALANAASNVFFVLDAPTLVEFHISVVGNLSDNRGGISLLLSQEPSSGISVPEPATLTLFGVGLVGLGMVARRRKTASL